MFIVNIAQRKKYMWFNLLVLAAGSHEVSFQKVKCIFSEFTVTLYAKNKIAYECSPNKS